MDGMQVAGCGRVVDRRADDGPACDEVRPNGAGHEHRERPTTERTSPISQSTVNGSIARTPIPKPVASSR